MLSSTATALLSLEAAEREAVLREYLAEQDLLKLDGLSFEQAIRNAYRHGCQNERLLQESQARLKEWQAAVEKGILTFKVVNEDGYVNVRCEPSASSGILSKKEPGSLVRGVIAGDWVKLSDESGYMLMVKPDGSRLLHQYDGDKPAEGGDSYQPEWVEKLFNYDRLSREALVFLAPELRRESLLKMKAEEFAPLMFKLGRRLYDEGSLPGNPTWEWEECPEFAQSLTTWREAAEAKNCMNFHLLLVKASELAEEGYDQMGNLAPRLAILRWVCCMKWLRSRSEAVNSVSIANCLGTVGPKLDYAANMEGKKAIFGWLRAICLEWPVITLFDFDLLGNGVWHDGKREPLPKRAVDEWYRRGIIFDIVKLCHQAMEVPPEDMNPSAPTLTMVQPYLTPDWILLPPEAPRHILQKHGWITHYMQPSIEQLHTKGLVLGQVLHIERPREYEHDFGDPEVIEKVQRGEDLGKGTQNDGLPGAIHGSVALFYAAYMERDKVQNLHVYPGLLELDGFFEHLLRYGPPLMTLELGGSKEACTEEHLRAIASAGSKVVNLDLSDCKLGGPNVQALLEMLEQLPNLKHLDLAHNELDHQAAQRLIMAMAERRIDIPSVRLDSNPIDNAEDFRNDVASCLAARGEQVIAGGELVLHLEDDMVRWCPRPKEGELAARLRNEDRANAPVAIALKEIKNAANATKRRLDKYEQEDEAAKSSGGIDWLARQRTANSKILDSSLLALYKQEIQFRVKMKDEAEAAAAAAGGATNPNQLGDRSP